MDGNLGICDFPSFFFIENEETATEFENISAVVSVLFDDDTMYGDREAIALTVYAHCALCAVSNLAQAA